MWGVREMFCVKTGNYEYVRQASSPCPQNEAILDGSTWALDLTVLP